MAAAAGRTHHSVINKTGTTYEQSLPIVDILPGAGSVAGII
jgi:hypothetical protein